EKVTESLGGLGRDLCRLGDFFQILKALLQTLTGPLKDTEGWIRSLQVSRKEM
ncbi:hypothetical protein P7K49_024429, partial [Saguinus oedipus]